MKTRSRLEWVGFLLVLVCLIVGSAPVQGQSVINGSSSCSPNAENFHPGCFGSQGQNGTSSASASGQGICTWFPATTPSNSERGGYAYSTGTADYMLNYTYADAAADFISGTGYRSDAYALGSYLGFSMDATATSIADCYGSDGLMTDNPPEAG